MTVNHRDGSVFIAALTDREIWAATLFAGIEKRDREAESGIHGIPEFVRYFKIRILFDRKSMLQILGEKGKGVLSKALDYLSQWEQMSAYFRIDFNLNIHRMNLSADTMNNENFI